MGPLHTFAADVVWTGAGTTGTTAYTAYSRDHDVRIGDKPPLPGSSDPAFRGDPARYSPEELLVASLAQCHMLWFLHLACVDGVVVTGYTDSATGTMRVEAAGHGQFTEVVLRPRVSVAAGTTGLGTDLAHLHARAHEHCFVARSVNFPVRHVPAAVRVAPAPGVRAPDAPAPGVPAPGGPGPDAAAPGALVPGAPAPGATVPDASAVPEVSVPSAALPHLPAER